MLYACEALLSAYLIFSCYRIVKQGIARTVLRLGVFLAAGAAAMAVFFLARWLAPFVFRNLFMQALAIVGTPVLTYFALSFFLAYKTRKDETPVVQALKRRLAMPVWLARTLCGTAAFVYCGAVLAATAILVSIAGVEPGLREAIRTRSVFLRACLPETNAEAAAAATGGTDMQAAMSLQERFLNRFRAGLGQATHSIVAGTGMDAALEHLEALKLLLNLSASENAWLVEKNPGLKRLLNHPALKGIIENDHILDLLQQVGQGSVTAIYTLGDEPAIRALLEDREIMAVARGIDLLELRNQVRELRKTRGAPVACHWALSKIKTTLELDKTLADAAAWQPAPEGGALLTWNADTRIGLAKTGFKFQEGANYALLFRMQTEGQPTVLVNDEPVKLTPGDTGQTCTVTFGPGATRVAIMVDFTGAEAAGANGMRTCAVDAFVPGE